MAEKGEREGGYTLIALSDNRDGWHEVNAERITVCTGSRYLSFNIQSVVPGFG